MGDIIRLEARVMTETHFRALTPEMFSKHYAVKYRELVTRILQKEGKLPDPERVARELQ